jgi:hypothetical protein
MTMISKTEKTPSSMYLAKEISYRALPKRSMLWLNDKYRSSPAYNMPTIPVKILFRPLFKLRPVFGNSDIIKKKNHPKEIIKLMILRVDQKPESPTLKDRWARLHMLRRLS